MGFPYPKFIGPYQRDKLYAQTRPGDNGCIIWTGFTRDNYGYMSVHGRSVGVHRVAWVLHNDKEIPTGYEIDHSCRNTLCVNPSHLDPATRRENPRRRHGFAAAPEGGPDKECMLCGRLAHSGFTFSNQRWYCSNATACAKRVAKRSAVPVDVRCGDCRHQRRRHNAANQCLVPNCKCRGWWLRGDPLIGD